MTYSNENNGYSQSSVIDGILEINDKIEEEEGKDEKEIDNSKLTKLYYEQMLRGLYLYENPFLSF